MGNMLMDGIIKRARDLVRRGEKREQVGDKGRYLEYRRVKCYLIAKKDK